MFNLDGIVKGLLSDKTDNSGRLLQILCSLQQRYSYIPDEAIEILASELDMPQTEIRSVISFYSFLHEKPRGDYDIYFSDNITDQMSGSHQMMRSLCAKLNVEANTTRSDGRVTVSRTSCTGLCDQGPAMLVNGRAISMLDEARITELADLIESKVALDDWPDTFFKIEDNIRHRDIILNDEIVQGSAIQSVIDGDPNDVLDVIERSGLRGRGGAGFNTAKKWRASKDTAAHSHYVVCNADEGEPGTFKDRVLLHSYADDVIEGMTVCAGIIGARKGFIYLRAEYRFLREHLETVLDKRRNNNLLGTDILGKEGFDFDIEIHLGAGAYICGEESALIESLEGKRGIPRIRPPFPVTVGYVNQPTVVNNVETFIVAAKTVVFGEDWLRSIGTIESTGTKILSISGDCEKPGIYEIPFGMTIRQVLELCGSSDTQAVQIAGAAGNTFIPDEFDRQIAFESISTAGSFIVIGQHRDLLDMVQNFMRFFSHESCGHCTPCRVGTPLLLNLIDKIIDGRGSHYDMDEMTSICSTLKRSSHCGLGISVPNIVHDTMKKRPDIYLDRLMKRDFEPAFDLDLALSESRSITGRHDAIE